MSDVERQKHAKEAKLTAECAANLFHCDQDTGNLWWKPGALPPRSRKSLYDHPAGNPTVDGYLRVKVRKTAYYVHRIIWLIHYGEWPKNDVDHINLIKSDNRITNLRAANDHQNKANGLGYSESGIKNVRFKKGGYEVSLKHKGKNIYIGRFRVAEDAASAADTARKRYHGEFANGNHRHG